MRSCTGLLLEVKPISLSPSLYLSFNISSIVLPQDFLEKISQPGEKSKYLPKSFHLSSNNPSKFRSVLQKETFCMIRHSSSSNPPNTIPIVRYIEWHTDHHMWTKVYLAPKFELRELNIFDHSHECSRKHILYWRRRGLNNMVLCIHWGASGLELVGFRK